MNWVIYLFGSGVVFFLGIGLVLIGPVLFMYCQHRWMRALASVFAFIGLLLVGLSATPLSYWIYVVGGGMTLVWLITTVKNSSISSRHGKNSAIHDRQSAAT